MKCQVLFSLKNNEKKKIIIIKILCHLQILLCTLIAQCQQTTKDVKLFPYKVRLDISSESFSSENHDSYEMSSPIFSLKH